MILKHTVRTALIGLKTNKSRSALTILGIVIGVTAIIVIVSLGEGAQSLILGQIQGLGSRVIGVVPGRIPKSPTDIVATLSASLTTRDLAALERKENVPHAEYIIPVVFGSETISYEGRTYRPTIFGGNEMMADVYDSYPERGRNVTADEVHNSAAVVILGYNVADKLAPNSDLLNQRVKIKGKNFLVIGIRAKMGSVTLINFDEMAMMPYTTAQQYVFGIRYYNRFIVRADKDDFSIQTQADALKTVGIVLTALTLFLAMVAAISLVVGGIGIMNIMLVSVTERTREIGLRKAIGATNRDILMQFLLEAVILTGVGGVIGILLGAGLSFAISLVIRNVFGLDWNFTFPLQAALLGIGVSSIIGLIFGLYPARTAAKKSPIEALRYE